MPHKAVKRRKKYTGGLKRPRPAIRRRSRTARGKTSVKPGIKLLQRQPSLCRKINKYKNCTGAYKPFCVWKPHEGCRKRTKPYRPRKRKSRSKSKSSSATIPM